LREKEKKSIAVRPQLGGLVKKKKKGKGLDSFRSSKEKKNRGGL